MKHFAIIALATLAFTSCATNTGDPAKDARGRAANEAGKQIFNAMLSFGLNQGASLMAGTNGQDAAAGAFDAAKQTLVSSVDFGRIIDAYAGPQVGAVAQAEFAKAKAAAPQASPSYLANAAGAGLQLAANWLMKPNRAMLQ